MRRWIGFAVAALCMIEGEARADQAACARSAEQGQLARRDGKLREAHKHFSACTSDCPRIIANDCATWAEQVLSATPTIVVDAKDDGGHDVGDATLTIDGEVVARQLDGKAIPVDPGSHTLTLQRGTAKVSETIIAKEGAKARSVQMKLTAALTTAPVTADQPPPRTDEGGHTIYPWLLVGAGAIAIGAAVVYVATAPDLPSGCVAETETCTRIAGESDEAFADRQSKAGEAVGRTPFALIIGGVGAGAVVGGLIWHFLEPTKPRNAMITPWLSPGSAGIVARHTF